MNSSAQKKPSYFSGLVREPRFRQGHENPYRAVVGSQTMRLTVVVRPDRVYDLAGPKETVMHWLGIHFEQIKKQLPALPELLPGMEAKLRP